MMKTLLVFMFLIIGVFSVINAEKAPRPEIITGAEVTNFVHKDVLKQKTPLNKVNDPFPGGVLFFEDFEPSGTWHRWTSEDLTNPFPVPNKWHVTTWNALEDSSWWMADTTFGNNGGYDNEWYQVLDTDPIVLNDSMATLTFYHRYSVEDPAGAEDPYNGWDGMNVRISTNKGVSWTVLDAGTYVVTSLYSFGYQHKEGPDVPGWAGSQTDWAKETFNLKGAFSANDTVMIRFAFASDPAWSTGHDGGDRDAFAWQLDSIEVVCNDTIRFANYGNSSGMTGHSVAFVPPPGGDLWHIAEIPGDMQVFYPEAAPSPSHAAILQNSGSVYDPDSTYNPYMDNVFITGPISIPDTTPVYLDYKILPFLVDKDPFPDLEYFRWEARPVDSAEFDYLTDDNLVTAFADDKWTELSKAPYWEDENGNYSPWPTNMSSNDLSNKFRGQDVYLRFRFWSDDDLPIGPGLMIDDVVIYAPINPPAVPTGLTVKGAPEDTAIVVSWDYEEDIVYEVWRQIPGDQYIYRIAEVKDSVYVDTDIDFYQEYYYSLKAIEKYEGTSAFVDTMRGTEIKPITIVEFGYDDSMPDTTVAAATNKLVYVKFTPPYYPIDVKGLNIFLVKDGTGSTAQFTMWDDDGENGMPGTQLRVFNKFGMPEGWFKVIFDDSTAVDSGSVWLGYKRFGGGPASGRMVGADTSGEITGNTYLQTDSTLFQVTDRDAMVHIFMDSSRADLTGIEKYKNLIADEFILGKNYPNPFNPTTTIPFVVPAKAVGQSVTLNVYNVLGQKVATLFNGKAKTGFNTVAWDGLNSSGKPVGSGIYIYQLNGKNVSIANRMLLIK